MGTDLEQLRASVAARPADPVARAALAAATGPDPVGTEHADQAVALIESSLRLGAASRARAAAELLVGAFPDVVRYALLAAFPDVVRYALLAAEAALHDGDRDGARGQLEGLAARFPDDSDVRLRLMAIALGDGDAARALAWVEPVAPRTPETRAGYLQTLIAAGRHAEAADFAERSVRVAPFAPDLFQLLGVARLASDDHDGAIEAFSEALRLDPDRPGAHYNLAIAFALRGSLAAALGVVDAGLDRAPADDTLTGLRAHILARTRAD